MPQRRAKGEGNIGRRKEDRLWYGRIDLGRDAAGKRRSRTIAMPKVIVAQLRAHRTRQLEERLLAGERWQGERWGLVFPSAIGTPLEPRNLVTRYKARMSRARLPDIRFHDLRHSYASLLSAQGCPARTVVETLGHSQISPTMDTYAHIFSDVQRQAAEAMDRLFDTA